MRTRFTKVMAGLAALTALALGGSAIAGAGQNAKPTKVPTVSSQEQPGQAPMADADTLQQGSGADDATEPAGSEKAEAAETPGSEKAGDDGPGGHADEPGDPNADHQFEGKE